MQNKVGSTGDKLIPANVSSTLPIFDILNNTIPASMKTPEAKKTFGTIAFGGVVIALLYAFIKALPSLLKLAEMTFILIGFVIGIIVLWNLAPGIIRLLNNVGRTFLEKGNRALKEKYGVEWLNIALNDVKAVYEQVKARVTQVEAVAVNMETNAKDKEKEAEKKLSAMKKLTASAAEFDRQAEQAEKEKHHDDAREFRRQANETRTDANIAKGEFDAAKELSATYAQYGNQFYRALDVLKDNESAARIYIKLLTSSIRIVEDKLKATSRMREATEGLADIFDITNKADFEIAMNAVKYQISVNVANIKRNLESVSQNRLQAIETTKSQGELEAYIKEVDTGNMQKLNVSQIVDPAHKLAEGEKVDGGFKLFNR